MQKGGSIVYHRFLDLDVVPFGTVLVPKWCDHRLDIHAAFGRGAKKTGHLRREKKYHVRVAE